MKEYIRLYLFTQCMKRVKIGAWLPILLSRYMMEAQLPSTKFMIGHSLGHNLFNDDFNNEIYDRAQPI